LINKKIIILTTIVFIIIYFIFSQNKIEDFNNDDFVSEISSSPEIIHIDNIEYKNSLIQKNWFDAIKYCEQMNFNGRGWRLPSIAELDKIANIKMYGKHEDFPKNWLSDNYPKNAVHYKGGAYFLKKPFLEIFSKTTEKYHIFEPYVWTKEDIAVNFDHYVNDFAYAINISYYGATLMLKKDRLLTICVRAKY